MPAGDQPPKKSRRTLEPQQLVDQLEQYLLGSSPTLTGPEIAAEVGISMDVARMRWRSLGFTAVDDDEAVFTRADLEALRLTQRLHELGVAEAEDESALIRTLGRSFARLAEWQLTLLGQVFGPQGVDDEALAEMVTEVLPIAERLQTYVWKRHLLSAAARTLLAPAPDADGQTNRTAVGFADIVGYTRQSRSLEREELARLVDDFERQAQTIVTTSGGRIIKTIGDEVLFVADTAADAAEIALQLVEAHGTEEGFPELRVGVAWGPVLNRLGDVFGPTVNVASRLTSVARPGRVLVDKELADALEDDERYRLRRTRRQAVKGYRRLEPWRLRRSPPEPEDATALPADWETAELPPTTAFLHEKGKDILRAVDEVQSRLEGPPAGEGGDERPGG